jgi:predicted nucleic acid-binding protein
LIFVIDASVAVKWFIDDEPRHDIARDLLASGIALAAPDLILIETMNAFQKKVSSGQMTREQAQQAATALHDCFHHLAPVSTVLPAAMDRSIELKHPIYDCVYLICAEMLHGRLITDDEKFFGRCVQRGRVDDIVLLKDFNVELVDAIEQSVLPYTDKLLSLYQTAQETWSGICQKLGIDPNGGNLGKHMVPWLLYSDSLPRRRLVAALKELSRQDLAALLAVAWFGRGTDPDLAEGYRHALSILPDDTSSEVPYVAMQLQHIEIGLWTLRSQRGRVDRSEARPTD